MSEVNETALIQGSTLLEEPMTVSDLARKRHVSLQSASKLVQVLIERGWVTRVRKSDDRRQYLLEVNDVGKAHAKELQTLFLNYTQELMNELTVEQVAAAQVFLPALERFLNAITSPASGSGDT